MITKKTTKMWVFFLVAVLCLHRHEMSLSQDIYDQLLQKADAPAWTLNGQEFHCKVQKVYDGDSIKCILYYNLQFLKFDFRVNGIDTPEVASGVVREFGK